MVQGCKCAFRDAFLQLHWPHELLWSSTSPQILISDPWHQRCFLHQTMITCFIGSSICAVRVFENIKTEIAFSPRETFYHFLHWKSVSFLPHCYACFDLQHVVCAPCTCRRALRFCIVIGWAAMYVNKQLNNLQSKMIANLDFEIIWNKYIVQSVLMILI